MGEYRGNLSLNRPRGLKITMGLYSSPNYRIMQDAKIHLTKQQKYYLLKILFLVHADLHLGYAYEIILCSLSSKFDIVFYPLRLKDLVVTSSSQVAPNV